METINKKITAFEVFLMIDNQEHTRWTFDEREKYLCVLRNSRDIVHKMLSELTDKEWTERSNSQENLRTLDRYIAIARQIRITDFDGRIEPKKEFDKTPLYGYNQQVMDEDITAGIGTKGWEFIVIWIMVGIICYLMSW